MKHLGTSRPTRLLIGLGLALAAAPASADTCDPPSPECHLKNGEKLLKTDPKGAAAELLASYKLDERTDTLTLYAQAVQADGQLGLALETWQRIILFRESEIDAAKEAKGKEKAKANAKAKDAQAKSEEAATEIQKLWGKVGKVKLNGSLAGGTVTRPGGAEVDASKEILVTSGHDELVFKRADGSTKTLAVEVAAGSTKAYDVPAGSDPTAPGPVPPPVVNDESGAKTVVETKPDGQAITYTEGPRSKTMANVGLGVAGVGVVGLAVGTTFAIIARGKYSDAKDLGCDSDNNCPTGAATRKARTANDNAQVANVGLIGGGALVVTGAILYYVGHKSVRKESDVQVSITPDSVGIGWSFK
ncbi:MAG TPA: hypothetical protein VGM90_14245 [Kofleriaceae bacterium]